MNEKNQNQKILAIIPARGGSKGLPRKNILPLAGKPLIAYTIEAALRSKKLNRVIVSTNNEEILGVSHKYGAEVIMRPQDLAEDATPTEPVIKHAVSVLEAEGYKADIIVTLQPTSPFRTSIQIDDALKEIFSDDVDSVISLKEVTEHPYKMKMIKNGYIVPFLKIKLKSNRRQDMPTLYKENGAIYITKYDLIMNKDKIVGGNIKPFLMSDKTSIDIDTHLDLKIAECLLGDNK